MKINNTAVLKLLVVLDYQKQFGPISGTYAVDEINTTGPRLFDELLRSDPYFPTWVKIKHPSLLESQNETP